MSIVKDEIEEKNQEIERLRATIVEKGKQQESTWVTGSLILQIVYLLYRIIYTKCLVEQLRQEIETLRGQVEDEQGNNDMLQRGSLFFK